MVCAAHHVMTTECGHYICGECFENYLAIRMDAGYQFNCPEPNCKHIFTGRELTGFMFGEFGKRLSNYLSQQITSNLFPLKCVHCTSEWTIPKKPENPCVFCETCANFFCSECNTDWHEGKKCSPKNVALDLRIDEDQDKYGNCPKCQRLINKGDGCDHVRCVCGFEFWWSTKEEFKIASWDQAEQLPFHEVVRQEEMKSPIPGVRGPRLVEVPRVVERRLAQVPLQEVPRREVPRQEIPRPIPPPLPPRPTGAQKALLKEVHQDIKMKEKANETIYVRFFEEPQIPLNRQQPRIINHWKKHLDKYDKKYLQEKMYEIVHFAPVFYSKEDFVNVLAYRLTYYSSVSVEYLQKLPPHVA